jgi:hypothetical protein
MAPVELYTQLRTFVFLDLLRMQRYFVELCYLMSRRLHAYALLPCTSLACLPFSGRPCFW